MTFFSGEKNYLIFVLERVSVKSIQLRRSENMELENINKKAIEAASILVVGDAMLDRYWFGDASRISPEAPVPVVKVTRREDRLGGAANVAILARNQQMLRTDFESQVQGLALDMHESRFASLLPDHDAVILSDYGKGGLDRIAKIIAQGRTFGKPILIDPKGDDYSRYKYATCITPNRSELAQVVGQWRDEEDLQNRAQNLREELKLEKLLLTRSEEGMTLFDEDGSWSVPAQAREVFDVSGAGDTVISVLGVMLAAGYDWRTAVTVSNRAGSIVVGKLGTATVTFEELFGKQ